MPSSTQDIQTAFIGPAGGDHRVATDPLLDLKSYLQPSEREGAIGRIGHYELLEGLGQGGFGIVVKAFDEALQRSVAIKFLAPQLASTSPPRKFFLREARSAAQVRHDNVVQIYAVDETPLPYLVMEYIEGQTLQQRLDECGPFEPDEIVRLGRQIALGLAAAHEKGLIHRDVKPANILLQKGSVDQVKLADFGLARTADDASLTQSGFIVGTPMYLAPEQANGETIDHRADLFSLGSVLYSMVTGHPPFRAPTTMAVLKRVAHDRPRPILDVNKSTPRGLCEVISRLLSKSPGDRYSSALETARALELCLSEHPGKTARKPVRQSLFWKATGAVAALLTIAAIAVVSGGFAALCGQPVVHGHVESPPPPPRMEKPAVAKVEMPPPVVDEWATAIAALRAEEQIPAVVTRLKALNPEFDFTGVKHQIDKGVVVYLELLTPKIHDLSPLRALQGLRELRLEGTFDGGRITDLSQLRGMKLNVLHVMHNPVESLEPLAGIPLTQLSVWGFRGADLQPLKGMKLTLLNCGASKVRDLLPLRGMPLRYLCANISNVDDLTPLEGMPLNELLVEHTQVSDLTPIRKASLKTLCVRGSRVTDVSMASSMPIHFLTLNFDVERDLDLVRSHKTLQFVNHVPVRQFLESVSK